MKVDRGVTFHYAPPSGRNALIWTDIILGEVLDESSAVQRAGRLAGNIAHCENYVPGTYWTDEETWNKIISHNRGIDKIQLYKHENFGEAYAKSRKEVAPEPEPPRKTFKRVPIVITVDPSVIDRLKNLKNRKTIKEKIIYEEFKKQNYNEELLDVINNDPCSQISCPQTNNSYKKHILDVVKAANEETPLALHDFTGIDGDKEICCWQSFIDDRCNRLVVLWQVYIEGEVYEDTHDEEVEEHQTSRMITGGEYSRTSKERSTSISTTSTTSTKGHKKGFLREQLHKTTEIRCLWKKRLIIEALFNGTNGKIEWNGHTYDTLNEWVNDSEYALWRIHPELNGTIATNPKKSAKKLCEYKNDDGIWTSFMEL